MPACPSCRAEVLEIDVRCAGCGANLTPTGAHKLIGATVLGQYLIVDVLGQGGMSMVYRGRHKLTEQDVALKVLPPELAAYAQVKSRFVEEAKALAQLDHPNIIHLYNFGQEDGSFVLAMQFVQGSTWERLILTDGGQEWPVATRIAIDVLRGLEYAHGRGIVHRDMKPSNILVREDDGTATVMDFGIAKMTTSTRLTAAGQTMGTVRYMSPEQVRGHDVDARSDIYSLGATLYEAIVGDTPFDGDTHFDIMSKHLTEPAPSLTSRGITVPAVLEAAVMRSLCKKADDRFSSAREFRKELELALREADDGFAETQRLSRDSVVRGGAVSSPVLTPPSVSTAPRTGPIAVTAPATRAAIAAETDKLNAELLPPTSTGRNLPWLWIGLATLVFAAGAAVLWRLKFKDSPVAPASVSPSSLVLPQLEWKPDTRSVDGSLIVRVTASSQWASADIAEAVASLRGQIPALLAKHGHPGPAKQPPLSVVVVPREVLCSPGIVDGNQSLCNTIGSYYRPREKTLLLVDTGDQALRDLQLAEGLAEVACLYNEVTPCFAHELEDSIKKHR